MGMEGGGEGALPGGGGGIEYPGCVGAPCGWRCVLSMIWPDKGT